MQILLEKKVIIDSDKVFYKNKFFSDSKINFAENLLIKNNNDIAIYSFKENGLKESITWKELREKVFKISSFLNKIGLVKNDRVAAYVPNVIETVISSIAFTIKSDPISESLCSTSPCLE